MKRFPRYCHAALCIVISILACAQSEAGEFSFSTRRVSAEEGQSAVVEVRRSGNVAQAASVRWNAISATARSGADFEAGGGTLQFAPGVQSRQLSLALKPDALVERAEHFFLLLSHASRGNRLGRPFIAVVEIRDVTAECAGDVAKHFDLSNSTTFAPAHASFEQSDGRIVVAIQDGGTGRLRRFWPSGQEDLTFQPATLDVWHLFPLRNGEFMASGRDGIARLSPQGETLASSPGEHVVWGELADGSLLSSFGGSLERLSRNGEVLNPLPATGQQSLPRFVAHAAVLADDSIVGAWTNYSDDGVIVRMNAAGQIDDAFASEVTGRIEQILPLPDGSFLVRGFNLVSVPASAEVQPRALPPVVKLRADGRLDTAFNYPAEWREFQVVRLSLDPDGSVLVAMGQANFFTLLRRFAADGTADPDFAAGLVQPGDDTPWSSVNSGPWMQKDGSIFVSGSIESVNGIRTESLWQSYSVVMLSLYGRSVRCPGFIAPDDQPIFLTENAAPAQVTLRRLRGSHGSLTVPLRLLGGTAMENTDFSAWSQTVVFGPGEVEKSITLPVLDDALPELTESAFLEVIEAPGQRLLDRAGLAFPASKHLGGDAYAIGFHLRIVDNETIGLPGTPDLRFQPQLPERAWLTNVFARPSGQLLAAGSIYPRGIILKQFLPDGSEDFAFAPDLSALTGRSVDATLQSSGQFLLLTDQRKVVAFEGNGQRSAGFGIDGVLDLQVTGRPQKIHRLQDGSFLVQHAVYSSIGFILSTHLTRFRADGHIWPGNADFVGEFVAEQPPDRLLLRQERSVFRVNLSGVFDTTFQTITVDRYERVRALALSNAKLLIADTALRWFEADGTPAQGWPTYPLELRGGLPYGVLSTTFFEDPQGRVVVGGSTSPGLQRFLPDGSIDPGFFIGTGIQPYYNAVQLTPVLDGSGFYYGIGLSALNDLPLPPLFRLFGH